MVEASGALLQHVRPVGCDLAVKVIGAVQSWESSQTLQEDDAQIFEKLFASTTDVGSRWALVRHTGMSRWRYQNRILALAGCMHLAGSAMVSALVGSTVAAIRQGHRRVVGTFRFVTYDETSTPMRVCEEDVGTLVADPRIGLPVVDAAAKNTALSQRLCKTFQSHSLFGILVYCMDLQRYLFSVVRRPHPLQIVDRATGENTKRRECREHGS